MAMHHPVRVEDETSGKDSIDHCLDRPDPIYWILRRGKIQDIDSLCGNNTILVEYRSQKQHGGGETAEYWGRAPKYLERDPEIPKAVRHGSCGLVLSIHSSFGSF
jgi:hypothetical protein